MKSINRIIAIMLSIVVLLLPVYKPVSAAEDSSGNAKSGGYHTGSFTFNDKTYSYTYCIGGTASGGGYTSLTTTADVARYHETVTVKFDTASHGYLTNSGGARYHGSTTGNTKSYSVTCPANDPVAILSVSGYAKIYADSVLRTYVFGS